MDPEQSRPDDPSILDTDRLLRRIPPIQFITNEDGSVRPSSAAFKDPELSVFLESLMREQNRPLPDAILSFPGHALAAIGAGDVRQFGHPIVKDTNPPHDPAHGLVLGKKSGRFSKDMAHRAHWVVSPSAP